jgi:anaerobic selenocysteine-containing dehydrogenase
MNAPVHRPSACPHDCPSTCALEVEILDGGRTIGRLRGAAENAYTAGVICAKVARYAERVRHPDRLMHPLLRTGSKGSGDFRRISWDEALDRVAEAFVAAEARHGPQSVFPYYYAGTMGLAQRDGLNRLTHAKRYSRMLGTICVNMAWSGYIAGTGRLAGPDPREMADADLVVIWGTNAVSTQVNVMTHAIRARKTRGAKIVAIDVYRTDTAKQADVALVLRPGTDAALACAVMHVLFREGYADRDYLEKFSDCPRELEQHLKARTPEWAAAITGLSIEEIEGFARMIGTTPRTFLRLGYGFTRSRNGAVSMHAAASIATVAGLWKHEGGGAFHNNGAIYRLDKTMIEGLDIVDRATRELDQSRLGAILEGDADALKGGPPVTAMIVQNTNPASVCPEQERVLRGLARDDLFLCVHEQFMTETARMADIVLPATTFVEHDDIYKGGGHQYVLFGGRLVPPPGECRPNHDVVVDLARRLGAEHPGFSMSAREHVDWMLRHSGLGTLEELEAGRWRDCQPGFETAHYLDGFGHPDGRFHFRADWAAPVPGVRTAPDGPWAAMPSLPDYWPAIEEATDEEPFRLVTAPARSFLNSTFNETPSSLAREGRPTVMIHPADAEARGVADGDLVRLGNRRGTVRLHARLFDGLKRGVLVSEGIWPNDAFVDGRGINVLTGADPVAPSGGAAFHDNRVWLARG